MFVAFFYCIKEFIMNPIANMSHALRKYRGRPIPFDREFGQAHMYCGWGNRRLGLPTSPLANPYTEKPNARRDRIRVASRDEAVKMYREWLWEQICANNQRVLDELHQVTPTTTLICWCAPKRCHCEVISRAADWLRHKSLPR